MVGDLLIKVIAQIPTEGEVDLNFSKQSLLRRNPEQIPQQIELEQRNRVYRRLPLMRVVSARILIEKLKV